MHRCAVALLATAAIVGISVSASAADVPRKAPILYINFGDGPTVPVGTAFVGASGKLTDNIVRVGVNYKFF